MGPPERAQGWFPKQFDYRMFLLKEPINKIRTSQAHVARFAMETEMWSVCCRVIHPGWTTGISSRKVAADEYAETFQRMERKHTPVSRMLYIGLPSSKRRALIEQLLIALPIRKDTSMDVWLTKTPQYEQPTKRKRWAFEEESC